MPAKPVKKPAKKTAAKKSPARKAAPKKAIKPTPANRALTTRPPAKSETGHGVAKLETKPARVSEILDILHAKLAPPGLGI